MGRDPNKVITKRAYVGGLPPKLAEGDLKLRFEAYGDVIEMSIIREGFSGDCRGFGYVTLKTTKEGWKKCLALNDRPWKDTTLKVQEAKPDYLQRLAKEKSSEKRREKIKWQRLLRTGIIHSRDMSLVTDKNAHKRRLWKKGRYGRAIALMRLLRPDGTKIVVDPLLYKNNILKFHTEEDEKPSEPPKPNSTANLPISAESKPEPLPAQSTSLSTDKNYEINVNLKPLFGAGGGESGSFKLFGGDDDEAEEEDEEQAIEEVYKVPSAFSDSKIPALPQESYLAVNQLFFFHFDNDELTSRTPTHAFGDAKDRFFVRTSSLEEVTTAWEQMREEITREYKRKHKSASRKKTKLIRGGDRGRGGGGGGGGGGGDRL
ncbi:uncharacterized protein VTP21DRAFT_4510 [Calcarisporiella thermophila]|uniref:uncharacterized protein n=1 Tax=Calcarisporiella thermophila TaxID=911321 RepID=UPI003744710A